MIDFLSSLVMIPTRQSNISSFLEIARIQVHVVQTEAGTSSARHVIERLLEFKHNCEEDDELWMLLDTDHYIRKEHIRSFIAAIKKARKNGIKVALSKPCFEMWLLLHHVNESTITDQKCLRNRKTTTGHIRGIQQDPLKARTLSDFQRTRCL
ncbi:MAG: RloB family protein [Chromatiales bacterium]|nr:RloB family protein [Chromatiales bacterium]